MGIRVVFDGRKAVFFLVSILLALVLLVGSLGFRLASASKEGVAVPILMYHSVGYNNKIQSPYLLSPEAFESDMCWLHDRGYTAVFISDLVAYVKGTAGLPEKPVVITLDDGFLNNRTYVQPILEKYGMKAVLSVVGSFCEDFSRNPDPDPAYAYLTWNDVAALAKSGVFEIGNHTYEMHSVGERKGCMRRSDESVAAYSAALSADLEKLQSALSQKSGVTPTVFAYPYGAISRESVFVLQSLGFEAALTCDERINVLSSSREDLYRLGRFNRPSGVSTEEFMSRVLGG